MGAMDVYVSTVIRKSRADELSGNFYKIDWETSGVRSVPVPVDTKNPIWGLRGGNRGGRGIKVRAGIVYLGTAHGILKYDRDLNLLGEISSLYVAGLHEFIFDGDNLWTTATAHDIVAKIDLDGNLVDCWNGTHSSLMQEVFKFKPRTINLELAFPGATYKRDIEKYYAYSEFHVNAVAILNGNVYILCPKKASIVKIRKDEEVILRDERLTSAHNLVSSGNLCYINGTNRQSIMVVDLVRRNIVSETPTRIYGQKRSSQFAKSGWQRGLVLLENGNLLVGTSPATVFECTTKGEIVKAVKLTDDVRECVHGLEAH